MEQKSTASVACQTEPNLIDKLIDNNHVKKPLDDVDLYQEYVRSAQCAQFWPLDKNPIRSIVPGMVQVDLPEQHLKNESLMFDLVQAITNNSKLVNLLAKYIHHIVPNVIISKRIDLIPLITCTIRVCRDTNEQERLVSLLFNLIKRPNEEQRRMIISGIIVVLQVSPHQNSSLLLPNLWEHVNDKFQERRILLAESCATLAHYVRPIMRTNLILSILMQLLKDKNAAVRSAACKSFSCVLTLIMDRNDEVFDACVAATDDIIHDVLQQSPINLCEHRYELDQMRYCALETVYPLLCMWAVKLDKFKVQLAQVYLAKAEKFFNKLLSQQGASANCANNSNSADHSHKTAATTGAQINPTKAAEVEAVARRRSVFFESRANNSSFSFAASSLFASRRQSAFVNNHQISHHQMDSPQPTANVAMLTSQKAASAYLKMLNYLVPFVFSDAVHSCAWLSKPNLNAMNDSTSSSLSQSDTSSIVLPPAKQLDENGNIIDDTTTHPRGDSPTSKSETQIEAPASQACKQNGLLSRKASFDSRCLDNFIQLFDRPLDFSNKLLDPTLIIDESAIVAFHDQLEQEHMIESLDWILHTFLPRFLTLTSHFSHNKFYSAVGGSCELIHEMMSNTIASTRQLCLLFGKHLTRTKIRPLIKADMAKQGVPCLFPTYIASLTSFEPIDQQEFEDIVLSIRHSLSSPELTRIDVEILAISIKIIATNSEQIHSPSTRQKFLTYILDALVSYSNQCSLRDHQNYTNHSMSATSKLVAVIKQSGNQTNHNLSSSSSSSSSNQQHQPAKTKEFIIIIFRHILTCLIDPSVRPTDWAHILITKFLPLLISLANDSTDVHTCTYARLMCAQLVETFDTFLDDQTKSSTSKQTINSMLPALASLKSLTEQIKASNLSRQIECLINDLKDKFCPQDP